VRQLNSVFYNQSHRVGIAAYEMQKVCRANFLLLFLELAWFYLRDGKESPERVIISSAKKRLPFAKITCAARYAFHTMSAKTKIPVLLFCSHRHFQFGPACARIHEP
jgi:hypothetical protein